MDTITNKDWTLLIIGLALGTVLGFWASWWAGYLTLLRQFKQGSAWRRVRLVADATREFSKPNQITGALATEYRDDMGTIIDNFSNKRDNEIPLLIYRDKTKPDHRADGRAKFKEIIKPVIDTISPYSFPALFRWAYPETKQLYTLLCLCDAMELVVSKLDGGFENPAIVGWEHIIGGDENAYALIIIEVPGQEERRKSLRVALNNLEQRWVDWQEVCGAT